MDEQFFKKLCRLEATGHPRIDSFDKLLDDAKNAARGHIAAPWVNHDLTRESYNLGQWRLMESPLVFLIRNRAILTKDGGQVRFCDIFENCGEAEALYEGGRRGDGDEDEIEKFNNCGLVDAKNDFRRSLVIDKRRLAAVLCRQLGRQTRGVERFLSGLAADPDNAWRYGVIAALALHGFSHDCKSAAWDIVEEMNDSLSGSQKFNPREVGVKTALKALPPLLAAIRRDGEYRKVCGVHEKWENPWLMSLLEWARRRGVFQSCAFGWTRAFDRSLWHALNQAGRGAAAAEAAGAWSHYHVEEATGKALSIPFLGLAMEGFEAELRENGWLAQ